MFMGKNIMSKKSLVACMVPLCAITIALCVFVVPDADVRVKQEVAFSCPSGQEQYLTKELLSEAFSVKVQMSYRKLTLNASPTDKAVREAVGRPKITQQNYRDARWSAVVVFTAHAKTQEIADAVLRASLSAVKDLVRTHNEVFEQESLAQQKGKISKLQNKIKAKGEDPVLAEILSNEVRQVEISRKIVADNLIRMTILGE